MVDVIVKNPDECSAEELELFRSFLLCRPDINIQNLEKRIAGAGKLAFAFSEGKPAGISALKRAKKGFRRRLLEAQDPVVFTGLPPVELGWLYVDESFRGQGVGSSLVSALCNEKPRLPVFSLTTADNTSMRRILHSNSFSYHTDIFMPGRNSYCLYFRKGDGDQSIP
ncbi:GNAT family N-acetyltransferase [Spirochaeta isovalerica]|uniref:GNAT superfamily N-acetyltransferase n=1 Tax=Spirochaeta isovalerica TaxID=150 RepID=A0A841R7J7_9SPIO|nr:GNAT family N-acetyltransferase [Spirochaeta isovalerica]MBB6479351.1 GNAT superfamily N-acetyltransferase [Spirochaeta isovalerica]